MTTYIRRTKPHSTGLAVSAAKLGVTTTTEPQSTGNRGRAHRDGARPTPTCICGKQHWYTDCFILNSRHLGRPNSYQPAAETVCKVEEARKDSKIDASIKTALERWAARQSQNTGTLRIDDGRPPADSNTFVVSTGPSLIVHHHGHYGHNNHNHRDVHDDRDVHNDRDVHKGHDGHDYKDPIDRDDSDDDTITIDSRTETMEALMVLAVDDTNQTGLLNRWIVDPGFNTHVINTETWQGWKRTNDNPERRSVNAGNSRILSPLGARWSSLLARHMDRRR
jgi:hypothetical protein